MTPERMVHMANQIAKFFAAYPRDEAVASVADHLKKFWEPRMRHQLVDHVAKGLPGLDPLVQDAVRALRQEKAA